MLGNTGKANFLEKLGVCLHSWGRWGTAPGCEWGLPDPEGHNPHGPSTLHPVASLPLCNRHRDFIKQEATRTGRELGDLLIQCLHLKAVPKGQTIFPRFLRYLLVFIMGGCFQALCLGL